MVPHGRIRGVFDTGFQNEKYREIKQENSWEHKVF
jgi:hypothetical protein